MRMKEWDRLEEQVAVLTLEEGLPLHEAIGNVCKNNPASPVKCLLLAVVSYVTCIELSKIRETGSLCSSSLTNYRVLAALTADASALLDTQITCRDLVNFWLISRDELFLC